MALYEVTAPRLRLSAHRLAVGSGGVAGPNSSKDEKAKKDNGSVETIRFPLSQGQLVYTEEGDLDGVNDEAAERAFYAYDTNEVERFEGLDALEEVSADDYSEAADTSPRSFGLEGEDNGTDLDRAMGDEIRSAEEEGTLEEKFDVDLGTTEEDASDDADESTDEPEQGQREEKLKKAPGGNNG